MTTPDQRPPVDPNTLPDPEDITEADLPAPPPRPEKSAPRRFAGTDQQIKSALTMYKVCAWITGIMLLLLVFEMIFKYGYGTELYAGGTLADGAANTLSLQPEDSVTGGLNLSIAVLIAHGWLYVVYLVAAFRLWSLMRWNGMRLLAIAGGGVVPFLSFIVEKRVHRETLQELADHPEALRRY
ncbi:DUF3817 domain-containing protein [Citricoccus sp. NPDC079358]|uniref:DUF3817 domain-containing protein n=1 Tax=Citricoccus sp. NPDC079358 TaxID=3154653 RepID=UPI00344EE840